MATTYKVILKFRDTDGKATTFTYNHAKPTLSSPAVKTAMEAIITNGSIFKHVPATKLEAYLVKAEQIDFNIE